MENEFTRLHRLGEVLTLQGRQMILALLVLIVGLLVARWLDKGLRNLLRRFLPASTGLTIFCNVTYIIIVVVVITAAAVEFGAQPINMLRLLTIVALVAIGLLIFLKPFIPSMPFKVGNTVKAANLLGKVEAVTFLNTRLRTFDGKTFFVPNRQILNDVVINYHYFGTRRVKIDVNVRYDQDLLKAKRVLETVMVEDPRVKTKPGPQVYVLNLASSAVEVGGRCWVDNKDFWVTRCDLMEKTKLRFDQEGIRFAFPQLDLHIQPNRSGAEAMGSPATDDGAPPTPAAGLDEETA